MSLVHDHTPLLTRNRLHYQPPSFAPTNHVPEIVYDFSSSNELKPEVKSTLGSISVSYTLLFVAFFKSLLLRLNSVLRRLRYRQETPKDESKTDVIVLDDEEVQPLPETPQESQEQDHQEQIKQSHILPSDISVISVPNGNNLYESMFQIDSDEEIAGDGQYGTNLTFSNHTSHFYRDFSVSNTNSLLQPVFDPKEVSDILKPLDDYDVAISKFYTPFKPVPQAKYTVTDAVLSAIPTFSNFLKKERDQIQELITKERTANKLTVIPLNKEQLLVVERFWRAGRSSRPVVSGFSIDITTKDLLTLADGHWLNDNVIDFYLNLVSELQELVYCWTTHFYTTLKKNGYKGVARWAKRRKIDVLQMKTVIVPINSMNTHWAVAVVDNERHTISYYDSLGSNGNMAAVELLQHYMEQEADRLGVSAHNYSLCPNVKTPQQQNGYDCGVFTCTVAKCIAQRTPLLFSQKDMSTIRRRMAFEIVQKNLLTDSRANL